MKTKPKYMVRMINGYALKFITRGYSVVADDEADTFETKDEADLRARTSGLRWSQFAIEETNQKKEQQ